MNGGKNEETENQMKTAAVSEAMKNATGRHYGDIGQSLDGNFAGWV